MFLVAAVAALCAGVLLTATACGDDGGDSDSASKGGGEKTTITWWHNSNNEPGKSFYEKAAKDFEADHPGVTTRHVVARNDVAQLAALVRLVDAGIVTVDVSAEHPLSDAAHIHRLSEAGQTRGKIIMLPSTG